MHIYYVAGVPYSDELYHHGTKGMRWGVRLYQYEDGTLTPLGKIHYGVQKAGQKVGSGVKVVGSHIGDKIKSKHTWMMSDKELAEKSDRMKRENAYKQLVLDNKRSGKKETLREEIFKSGLKTLGQKAFNSLGDKWFGKKDRPVRDLEDIFDDPNATEKDLDAALKLYKARSDYANDLSVYKRYDINNLGNTKDMSKKELDNLNAWLSSERRTTESIKKTDEYIAGREALDNWLKDREKYGTDYHTRRI